MQAKIKVVMKDEQEKVKMPTGIRLLLRRCCTAVIMGENLPGDFEVNIVFIDDRQIQGINQKFRQKDTPTDVLSFPLWSGEGKFDIDPASGRQLLGDIVISVERAACQAKEYGHSFQREMAYLTAHAMFHLLGYDHVDGGLEQVRMREKEEQVMAEIGLPKGSSYIFTDKA